MKEEEGVRDEEETEEEPVDVIPQEEVVALRRESAVLEQAQEVVVLPVHVPWVGVNQGHISSFPSFSFSLSSSSSPYSSPSPFSTIAPLEHCTHVKEIIDFRVFSFLGDLLYTKGYSYIGPREVFSTSQTVCTLPTKTAELGTI